MTELGKLLKKERIDRDWILHDMAKILSISTAQLSHIERGRRKASDKFIDDVSKILSYNDIQKQRLKKAAENSFIQESIKIDLRPHSEKDQELLLQFARNFSEIDNDKKKKILELVQGDVTTHE